VDAARGQTVKQCRFIHPPPNSAGDFSVIIPNQSRNISPVQTGQTGDPLQWQNQAGTAFGFWGIATGSFAP